MKIPAIPALLAALLAGASLTSSAANADIPQRQRQSPDALRVISANVRYPAKVDMKTGDDWDSRKALARDVLLAQDADLICFQEFTKEHLEYLEGQLPGYTSFGFVDSEGGRKVNTVFYSTKRFEKISEGGAFLSATPDVFYSKFAESSLVRQVTRLHFKDRATGRELIDRKSTRLNSSH